MNKLTKLGVSALCGTLAAVSAANAGEMSVTGGATATWSSNSGDVTGNPIGMDSGLTFTGTGELDNGTAFKVELVHLDQNAGYSVGSIQMDFAGIGSVRVDQGAGGTGLDRIDDMMPTAWEETTGTSLGTGLQTVGGVGGSTNVEWAVDAGLLPDGMTAHIAYAPNANGAKANDKAGTGDTTGIGAGWDVVLQHSGLMDGVNLFLGASTIEQHTGPVGDGANDDRSQYAAGFTYAIGSVTLGYQMSHDDFNSSTSGTAAYDNSAYGISFSVNDDLSLSYGKHKSDRDLTTSNGTSNTVEAESLQIAYSMGGASLKVAESNVKNQNYASGSSNDKDATTVSLSLAF